LPKSDFSSCCCDHDAVPFTMQYLCLLALTQCLLILLLHADSITPGDEELDQPQQQRGTILKSNKELQDRLEDHDSFGFDSPVFQKIFPTTAAVALDDASYFSDIELESGGSTSSPSHSRERNSKKKQGTKHKKTKTKRSEQPEIDTSRPDTDRKAFESLQVAKEKYRKRKNHHPSGKNYQATMPTITRASASGAPTGDVLPSPKRVPRKARPDNDGGGENTPANGQDEAEMEDLSRKRKADAPPPDDNDINDVEMKRELGWLWDQDKKIPLNKRGEKIQQLNKEIYKLKKALLSAKRVGKKYRMNFHAAEKTIADLRKELEACGTTTQEEALVLKVNLDILKLCKEITKNKLWRKRKFISDADGENKAAEFVLGKLDLPEMKNIDVKASMIKTYKCQIKKALYAQKNYVSSEFKKVVWAMFRDGKTIPTIDQIKKCISRDIQSENDMELMQWYWEVLLPKMIGAREWDVSVRYYTTISKARDAEDSKERLITVSDEAMCLLIWENCYDRWMTEWNWEQHQKTCTEEPTEKKEKKPKWAGKFTNSDLGQCRWGGWKAEGYQAFNEYHNLVRDARKDKKCMQVEKKCLQELRIKHNITQQTRDLQENENRRIKRAKAKGIEVNVGSAIPNRHLNIRPVVEGNSDEEEEDFEEDFEVIRPNVF
jgi:hypothetical protein